MNGVCVVEGLPVNWKGMTVFCVTVPLVNRTVVLKKSLTIRTTECALRDETKVGVRNEAENKRPGGEVADHGRVK